MLFSTLVVETGLNIPTGVYIDLLVMSLKMRLSRISTFFSSELEAVAHDKIPYLIRE